MVFKQKFNEYVEIVNTALNEYMPEKDAPEKTVYSSMRYSLTAGGKRLRPVLALAVTEMLGGDITEVMPYACAIEMIHTYSLIHDDLPAMDNDDYRRGSLTNHKVYGDAMAILAGDGLLNGAFELMLHAAAMNDKNLKLKVSAMHIIARAAGVTGMIGGQVVDLESEGEKISGELLEYMHRCKTGALIKAPVMAAAEICNALPPEKDNLIKFAENIGLAFQIKDDILDVEGEDQVLGKRTGSDAVNEKSTFITLYGLEQSKKMLAHVTREAVIALEPFDGKAWFLTALADYLLEREK